MSDLPDAMLTLLLHFSPVFSRPTFKLICQLACAHMLTKGRRTMADLLRTAGLKDVRNFSKYHGVFYKGRWSPFRAGKILFGELLKILPQSEIQFVMDSTVERRKGPKIKSIGRKRDPVASTKSNKVLCIGQEWLVVAAMVQFFWARTKWACPFFSILMPPKMPLRTSKNKKELEEGCKPHKKMTRWASQVAYLLRRWLGKTRKCSLVADSAFACYSLAHTCVKLKIGLISRLRLDARLFERPQPAIGRGRKRLVGPRIWLQNILKDRCVIWTKQRVSWYNQESKEIEYVTGENLWYYYGNKPVAIKWVLIRDPEGSFAPIALFSTDLSHDPTWIIESFVCRWRLEVTFEEIRRHLGYETQRHWGDNSVDRISPCIITSFTLTCLMALNIAKKDPDRLSPQKTSWYKKKHVTFSDVLKLCREEILMKRFNSHSRQSSSIRKRYLEDLLYCAVAA